MISGSDFKPFQPVLVKPLKPVEIATRDQERLQLQMRQVKFISIFTEIPSKLISAHTFAYISLDAMIPQEADQTHIEYGFPVIQLAQSCLKYFVLIASLRFVILFFNFSLFVSIVFPGAF